LHVHAEECLSEAWAAVGDHTLSARDFLRRELGVEPAAATVSIVLRGNENPTTAL
jgi:hypothetical protein